MHQRQLLTFRNDATKKKLPFKVKFGKNEFSQVLELMWTCLAASVPKPWQFSQGYVLKCQFRWLCSPGLGTAYLLSRMFVGYEDAEDIDMYEDELYHEESSSEQSVDSEVEFHLYSQIHYSQNLGEISTLEMDEEADVAGTTGHSSVLTEEQPEGKKITEFIGHGAQLSHDPEVIVLSDTPDEDSVYKSKAKKSTSSSSQGRTHIPPGSSTPNHAKAATCSTLSPAGPGTDPSRERRSTGGKPDPGSSAGAHALQDVFIIDDSSEEDSYISDSENVESWMLLGAGADDTDEDIMLNLEGCATPVSEG
ncbi:zinc finger cchc domain-containing protein 7 [Limosa lapponica baueri]|uniref:Zinc finger cchc domain-containing protein 7 n=1 Tax=Limosa lapponica baueri TaxID=1758121 RepID=A0A2I0TZE8_LIMLA|nr:zinc finger cchc domain-containing protein 7 [Limosa lapponica baueri]